MVVARAWVDPEFVARLLTDATGAAASLGFGGGHGAQLVALAQTGAVHNVVVCTLCSCYPTALLGPPPEWYKSDEYRARVVRDPRGVLAEFGTVLPDDVTVRVWDSTSEVRYLTVPRRPAGSRGPRRGGPSPAGHPRLAGRRTNVRRSRPGRGPRRDDYQRHPPRDPHEGDRP